MTRPPPSSTLFPYPPLFRSIAKGMWQLIPETGKRYGLTIGPLMAYRRADPADDRHKWEKATVAATRYIKDIYSTDAQASVLLDRKSTRLNSSHSQISYAVFC